MASVDKLTPDDTRVTHHTAKVGKYGHSYHYLLAQPTTGSDPVVTVLLVHGFPDLAFGWRYQVPFLQALGCRVIVPDQLGYGRTDAPDSADEYGMRVLSDDLAEIARAVVGPDGKIVIGGHDWGASLVWRVAMWHPDLMLGVFAVCVPYHPVYPPPFYDLGLIIASGKLPNLKYQLQLRGSEVDDKVGKDPAMLRKFLTGLYGGRGPEGQTGFSADRGVLFDNLDALGPSPLVTPEEMDFYVQEFSRSGVHGPLNWYRTRKLNFDDEVHLAPAQKDFRFKMPSLLVMAEKDTALPPAMADGVERWYDDLTKKVVNSSHWALWQAAAPLNDIIKEFIEDKVLGKAVKASI